MTKSTRRQVITQAAVVGAAALGVAGVALAKEKRLRPQRNNEPPVASKASADVHGPRELFAVVDSRGTLQRGMHVAAVRVLDVGLYEVIFKRDVRSGVYLATIGGHGAAGLPSVGSASVQGRATNPRGVVVSTADAQGDSASMGFHLLVICPDGYA
jgi:hypothetical protein